MKSLTSLLSILIVFLTTSCHQNEKKIDTYENLKKDLNGVELEKVKPHADPIEFEAEVNNGGLSQYFFNSSGQNCFETLRYFKQAGKTKEAKILEEAINLINPQKLSEEELIEKIRKRLVTELDDSTVKAKLDILDASYYK
ncbi:MAG TPA: DUF4375 domain-containing protein [Chitinophagaceae bacterium]|nr:DUF4375 domain-containing protein [Chitinophagaceae bacterium]